MKQERIITLFAMFLIAIAVVSSGMIVAYAATPVSFWKSLDLSGRYIWLPDIVGNFFEGSQISLHFHMLSGETLDVCGTVETAGGSLSAGHKGSPAGIFSLSWATCANADYDVSMSDGDALSLATSTTPMRTFSSLEDAGNMVVKPRGDGNAAKYRYAKANFLVLDGQAVPQGIRDYFSAYENGGNEGALAGSNSSS